MKNAYANPAHRRKAEAILKSFNKSSSHSVAVDYQVQYHGGHYTVALKIKGMKGLYRHSTHKL